MFVRHSEALLLLLQLFNCGNRTSKSINSDDALGYLTSVKVAFQNNKEKYAQFLKVLIDFRAKRIRISGVKTKLKTLFKGHRDLILEFNTFMPKKHRIALSLEASDASAFVKALKLAIQDKRENNYDDFVKVMMDYNDQTIDLSCLSARMKVLLKFHPDLILEFNTFMPSQYCIKTTRKRVKENGEFDQLPWDVLDIICKTLDFDDLFSFSDVCKNWRTFHIHKSNYLSSQDQEPLLVRMMYRNGNGKERYSLISIPNQKVYDLKMMNCFGYPDSTYIRFSSGYFIMAFRNKSFLLFNPFTRIKKVIKTPFRIDSVFFSQYEVLLAFEKCSEEFVFVVLGKESSRLYVYQSRYHGWTWVTCSTLKPEEVVVDFVVLNNIIYVLTNNANIGVLNLNSVNIQFLSLKNTPDKVPLDKFVLVNCDEQLLVFDSISMVSREAYKIDLSTMNYVKMTTLGDIALFYVSSGNCRALSNPKRFGYESNHVYEVDTVLQCIKYDWNYGIQTDTFPYQGSRRDFNFFDWCFRHIKYEVDYSLVE